MLLVVVAFEMNLFFEWSGYNQKQQLLFWMDIIDRPGKFLKIEEYIVISEHESWASKTILKFFIKQLVMID